jgi:hypothetical protein
MDTGVLVPGIIATFVPSKNIAKISLKELTNSLYSSDAKTKEKESVFADGTKSNSSIEASCVALPAKTSRFTSPGVPKPVEIYAELLGPTAEIDMPDESIIPPSNPITPVPPVNIPLALLLPVYTSFENVTPVPIRFAARLLALIAGVITRGSAHTAEGRKKNVPAISRHIIIKQACFFIFSFGAFKNYEQVPYFDRFIYVFVPNIKLK